MEGHRNVVDQLFTYHLHQLNQYHQDHSPSPTQQQQHTQPQHTQHHTHPSLGDIHLSQIQHSQHDIYAHQHAQQAQSQHHATHQQQVYHGHPHLAHQHAQHLHRPPSRPLSPQVSERDVGTPIGEDDYLIARHPHPHGHQHQPQHSHLHHELDLEMTDATGQQPQAGPSSGGLAEPTATGGTAATGVSDQALDEEPLYVNAKQYYRILKRRVARARLEELHRLSRQRKPYLHESRHKHAMRRPRGPGGRFLTAEEIAAKKNAEAQEASSLKKGDDHDDGDHDDEAELEGDADGEGSPDTEGKKTRDQSQAQSQSHSQAQSQERTGSIVDPRLLSLSIPSGPGDESKQPASASPVSPFAPPHIQHQRAGMYMQQHRHGQTQTQSQMLHPGYGIHRSHSGGRSPLSATTATSGDGTHVTPSASGGSVTLHTPYAPSPNPHSPIAGPGSSPSSYFPPTHSPGAGGDNSNQATNPAAATPQPPQVPTQLHHVPHPHAHHSRIHPRHTHIHGQPHPSEAGSLYAPFDLPVSVDLDLLSFGVGPILGGGMANGISNGMSNGLGGSGTSNGMEFLSVGLGGGVAPGAVRVGRTGLTSSDEADLNRRSEEILAFSVRSSMGGAGDSGR